MNQVTIVSDYNEHLFAQHTLRYYMHNARFIWLNKVLTKLNFHHSSVVELGCFDAKTIPFLPTTPNRYTGIDANWGNGLDIARQKYSNYEFIESVSPTDLCFSNVFDFGICQETFEHIHPDDVLTYIHKMSTCINGYFIVTVPNETGPVFMIKHLYKLMKGMDKSESRYSFKEFIYETFGQTEKVERTINGHKGFNYKFLVHQLSKYFNVLKVEGIPFKTLPPYLNTTIGIIAKSKS